MRKLKFYHWTLLGVGVLIGWVIWAIATTPFMTINGVYVNVEYDVLKKELLARPNVEASAEGAPVIYMGNYVKTFVDLCIEHYGKKPIIYSSEWFYKHYKLDELGCPFWSGDVDAKVHIPHVIHQQTIKSVPGIAGKVDYDVLKCSLMTFNYKQMQ